MAYPQIALIFAAVWLAAVAIRFQRSRPVLIGGLVVLAAMAGIAVAFHRIAPATLGLSFANPWWKTLGFAAVWTALMLAWSPLADRIARAIFAMPPTLGAFRALQESRAKLIAGIAIAWLLGGVLEELAFRGIILTGIETLLAGTFAPLPATACAVVVAALGAGVIHLYQGPRAVVIIVQLSLLFGILFVVSGHDLVAVMLCHGFYDTIAFIRFANKSSRFAKLDSDPAA